MAEVQKMKDVREFLAQLSRELQRGEDFDIEARRILEDLNKDADRLEASGGKEAESMLDRVKELESRFAANHPVLERLARELADAIAKMGI
jgi:cell division septum initiation protein DivIVA